MTLGRNYSRTPGSFRDKRMESMEQNAIGSPSSCSSSMSMFESSEPDECIVLNDTVQLEVPNNDVTIVTVPRPIRTLTHFVPEEDLSEASLFVRDCIEHYTSDWKTVVYKDREYSTGLFTREKISEHVEKLQHQDAKHQYEVDIDPSAASTSVEDVSLQQNEWLPCDRQSVTSSSSSSSYNEAYLELHTSDQTLLEQLHSDELISVDENELEDILGYLALEEEDPPERRLLPEMPQEITAHRLLINCQQLKLDLEIEPIFASMAIYDAKERKKVSENFYFNTNGEAMTQALASHIPYVDLSTLSRSAVFDILYPSNELFLVIRIEKVLQGDINECAEPYIKDDKRDRERAKLYARAACERLGRYRQPLAFHALSLHPDDLPDNTDRKSSCASLERRDEININQPINVTVTHFYKQVAKRGAVRMIGKYVHEPSKACRSNGRLVPAPLEGDKLRDEDLFKFLSEVRRPSATTKRYKQIPGLLKLEISSCGDELPNTLSPELAKLKPFLDESARPSKEILPFPVQPVLLPHYQYRNLLYVYPKELNFTNVNIKSGSARNIAVRIQLMSGEDQSCAMKSIFGKSSCPEFSTEAFTTITYHNKCPVFYDEIKMRLPATLSDQHHLLFTFYHISCQRKPPASPEQDKPVETAIGYTWLPLCRGGHLTSGEISLPVMTEHPPPNYSYIFPDVQLPGTKWHDNHKPLFTIALNPFLTVHPMDRHIERFAVAYEALEEGCIPPRIGLSNMESELRSSLEGLSEAEGCRVIEYCPVLFNRLARLLVCPPTLNGNILNVAHDTFKALLRLTSNVTRTSGTDSVLCTYVHYQHRLPSAFFSEGLLLHEELVTQWIVASGMTKDLAMYNSKFLFELIIKSMVEYLWINGKLETVKRDRFTDQYTDDITTLVNVVTSEIISKYDGPLTQSLNDTMAFFLFDLLNIMDHLFVFSLIGSYYKQMSAKIASLPDAASLVTFKSRFVRIILSHEHSAALSGPLCQGHIKLTHHYRRTHFLPALLLAGPPAGIARRMALYDNDPRSFPRPQIAGLYLPLINIAIDAYPKMHRPNETLAIVDEINEIDDSLNSSDETDEKQEYLSANWSRSMCACVVWLFCRVPRGQLAPFIEHLSQERLLTLLRLLDLCSITFRYQGNSVESSSTPQSTTDIKARLEDVILGQGSARSELMKRKVSGVTGTSVRRWRVRGFSKVSNCGSGARVLGAACAIALLNGARLAATRAHRPVLALLLRALARDNSAYVLKRMLVDARLLCDQCGQMERGVRSLASASARLCASRRALVSRAAAATLYALMRDDYKAHNNFTRVRMQVTLSVSRLAGWGEKWSGASLRRALRAVLLLAKHDPELRGTPFPEQVKDLVFNLHTILSDTVKMKEYRRDPEMLLDLMQRVARGYRHSPHLRLTWLSNMADKHIERGARAEAGVCLIAAAATLGGPLARRLLALTPHAASEPHDLNEPFKEESGFNRDLNAIILLERAANELVCGGLHEAAAKIYQILVEFAPHRDYKRLAHLHSKMSEVYAKIEQLQGKRVFGTYFRVGFYGSRFNDLNGEEFIYKEPILTKLPEIFNRLEIFYSERFGAENVVIIKDSNIVDVNLLDPEKAYIQITYVEPYFEPYEMRRRVTEFEKNFNIRRFSFARPFTRGGRAHGGVREQHTRRTVLSTSCALPATAPRAAVTHRAHFTKVPLQLAIEDMQRKISELDAAREADAKMLQMVVQGCIGTAVNQGPLELAHAFLPATDKQSHKLRLCFKEFSKKCRDALILNETLIGPEQRDYQTELERNFCRFVDSLAPLANFTPQHVHLLCNGFSK